MGIKKFKIVVLACLFGSVVFQNDALVVGAVMRRALHSGAMFMR